MSSDTKGQIIVYYNEFENDDDYDDLDNVLNLDKEVAFEVLDIILPKGWTCEATEHGKRLSTFPYSSRSFSSGPVEHMEDAASALKTVYKNWKNEGILFDFKTIEYDDCNVLD
jgi:hypothetical protein